MPSLKSLGLAAAMSLLPACGTHTEQPKQEVVTPEVDSTCERFRAAIGMEVAIEQMASDPAAWKLFPAPLAEAAWKDAHAEAMVAAKGIKDQATCLKAIREGE